MSSEGSERKKRSYKKRQLWSTEAEDLLLGLWEKYIDNLRGVRRNGHVYEDMAKEMKDYGFSFSAHEIKLKIHNLGVKYRDEQKKIGPSGGSPSNWVYFSRIKSIIGSFKCNAINEAMEESTDSVVLNIDEETEESTPSMVEEYLDGELQFDNDDEMSVNAELPLCSTPEAKPNKPNKRNYQGEVLKQLQYLNRLFESEQEERRQNDRELVELQKKVVNIEEKRNDLIEKLVNSIING